MLRVNKMFMLLVVSLPSCFNFHTNFYLIAVPYIAKHGILEKKR